MSANRDQYRRNLPPTRRDAIRGAAAGIAAGALVAAGGADARGDDKAEKAAVKGRIKQSACRWCYGSTPIEDLAAAGAKMGLVGIDLLGPDDFPVMKKHGLVCTMTNSHRIDPGLARKENHEMCLAAIRKAIEANAAAGYRNVICFSGNRVEGLSDAEGLKNCAEALKQVVPMAEKHGQTISMELLNSKVDHKGYMCDRTPWGADLVQAVGSKNFKLLYDIYHMQIMEGDVIRTIRDFKDSLGHYHTGGVPGRREIDEGQELYYPAIMKAIADMGYEGFVAQEFIPAREPLVSLAEAVKICDV